MLFLYRSLEMLKRHLDIFGKKNAGYSTAVPNQIKQKEKKAAKRLKKHAGDATPFIVKNF